jgi:hypothetical protein
MPIFGQEEPQVVDVHDRPLHCLVCEHDTFYRRRAQLHGRMATMFNVEWTAPVCDCMVCGACGYIHWFFPMKE